MGCTESRTTEKKNSSGPNSLTKELQYLIYECIVEDDDQKLQSGFSSGFDINLTMDHFANRTLLHISCELGSEKIVNMLVKKGCELNKVDDYGMTPVLLALMKGNSQCVRVLEQAGVSLEVFGNRFDETGVLVNEKNRSE